MKKFLVALGMIAMLNVQAQEATSPEYVHPSESDIQRSQNCFQEVERQGCPGLEENQSEFRSCLSRVQDSLDDECKRMMLNLYGTK
jgi:hypothetical protein